MRYCFWLWFYITTKKAACTDTEQEKRQPLIVVLESTTSTRLASTRVPSTWRSRPLPPSSRRLPCLINKGREDPCRKTDVGRRFTCALPVIFGVTDRYRLSKTSYCTFGHDHILKCPNVQTTYIHTYIHTLCTQI